MKLSRICLPVFIFLTACGPQETGADGQIYGSNSGTTFSMTGELPDITRRLTNYLGTCWLQAGVKELEFSYYRVNGKPRALSTEHVMQLTAQDRFLRIVQGEYIRQADIESGGELNETRRLVDRGGLIPESTWGQAAKDWREIASELNPIAADYRDDFRRVAANGESTRPVIFAAQNEFSAIMKRHQVHTPTWFKNDGKKVTPLDLAHHVAPEHPDEFVFVVPEDDFPKQPPTKMELETSQDAFVTSWENIERMIIDQVDNEASVLAAVFWNDRVIKISDDGFLTIPRDNISLNVDGHVINIVGYHVDRSGHLDRIKIENSWGRYEGRHGFYVADWNDFKKIFDGISIPDGFRYFERRGFTGTRIVD